MRNILHLGVIVWLSLAFTSGCDTQDLQEEFIQAASSAPSGFTHTTPEGEVLEEDPDDWRTAPIFVGSIRFRPAYPNPTSGEPVTLPFSVLQFNAFPGGLVLRGYDNTGRFVLLDEEPEASQPGSYAFFFTPDRLSASGDLTAAQGLHRLFVFDARGELVTYGDLMVKIQAK